MADVLVEEKECAKCGAEIRSDTQFCYNCGESTQTVATSDSPSTPSEKASDANGVAPTEVTDLRSAASLRRKGRDLERKPVEVVWEPAENRANLPLITATVLLVIFATGVILSALYYR